MQLRTNLKTPVRFEGGDSESHRRKQNQITIPRFPHLLQQQVVPFNKNCGNAAFPSLPLAASSMPDASFQSLSVPTTQGSSPPYSGQLPAASFTGVKQPVFTTSLDSRHNDDMIHLSEDMSYGESHGLELDLDPNETVNWAALEISVQFQIFTRLSYFHNPEIASGLLGLTDTEAAQIECDTEKRRQTRFASIEAWQYLQTGCIIEPELATRYSNELLFDARYEEAYPLSLQRATVYLQQRNLTPSLLGEWHLSQDGSGMLKCGSPPTAPGSAAVSESSCSLDRSSEASTDKALPSRQHLSYRGLPRAKGQPQPLFESIDTITQVPKVKRSNKVSKKFAGLLAPAAQVPISVPDTVHPPSKQARIDEEETVQTSRRRKKSKPNTQRRLRLPFNNIASPVAQTESINPILVTGWSQTVGSGERLAGKIKLRDRKQLRPTERGAEMISTPEIPSDRSDTDDERFEVEASPSSPFITLTTKTEPRLSINMKTGRAEVKSSPVARSFTDVIQIARATPLMELSPMVRNRILPDNAAEAIMMDLRRNSTASSHMPVDKSDRSWKYPQLMNDSGLFTPCFKRMPMEEQQRLLSIHPSERNVVQTWLIYGVEAWNKHRLWNANFRDQQHLEPEPGEDWDQEAAGSVLGNSIVAQWNTCQRLGLGHDFFADAKVGEKIIDVYEALSRMLASVDAGRRKENRLSGIKIIDGAPRAATIAHIQDMRLQMEANVWQEIKDKYLRQLTGPIQDKLSAMPSPGIILFHDKLQPESQRSWSVLIPASLPGTPVQLTMHPKKNDFTSKALGLDNFEDQDMSTKTPETKDLGVFAQGLGEVSEDRGSFSMCVKNDNSPLGHRVAVTGTTDGIAENDVTMLDSGSSYYDPSSVNDAENATAHCSAAAPSANDAIVLPKTVRDVRQAPAESPAFSPISHKEVEAFFADAHQKRVKQAATLLFEVSSTRSAPMLHIVQPSGSRRENLIFVNGSDEIQLEQQPVASETPRLASLEKRHDYAVVSIPHKPTEIELRHDLGIDNGNPFAPDSGRGSNLSSGSAGAVPDAKKTRQEEFTVHNSISVSAACGKLTTPDGHKSQKASRESTPEPLSQATFKSHAASSWPGVLVKQRARTENKSNAKAEPSLEKVAEAEAEDAIQQALAPASVAEAKDAGKLSAPNTLQVSEEPSSDNGAPKSVGKGSGRKRGPYRKTREKNARLGPEHAAQAEECALARRCEK